MKKVVILLGSLLTAASVALGGYIFYARANQPEPDKLSNGNINVMLARPDNWRQIASGPVISAEEMRIIDGSTATIPITAELLRQFYDFSDYMVQNSYEVHHSTTHSAYENLIVGNEKVDVKLILVTPPSAEELALAEQNGVELELVPVATDGFVFITHKNNPVDSLTAEQIRDIYGAGSTITNWKQV
ncbi:MAG: substrate-binding domain-containing protein, partial [Oscillospiraceae bacterium]|nr:substrate-binding domain-containing protein [Oscillospiraceae bacterium]